MTYIYCYGLFELTCILELLRRQPYQRIQLSNCQDA
jgi:hypothetical protein